VRRHHLVRNASGEVHDVVDVQSRGERHEVVEAVPGSEQREVHVIPPQLVDEHRHGAEQDVDPVLRPHDAEVAEQMALPSAQRRLGVAGPHGARVGPVAHHRHVLRTAPTAAEGHTSVGLVGGDHVVRRREGGPLEEPQHAEQDTRGPSPWS
jgi:hypothetical protein